jgi:antitoxin YefM
MWTVEDVSYTEARERLADLWDMAVNDRETIRMSRRGHAPVVLVAADEYEGLVETAHLLRSPENGARLLSALKRAMAEVGEPKSIDELRAEFERAEAE